MNLNKYLSVSPEVQEALAANKPVVALESTIISHGMPYPQNVETALNVEKIIRENGAVPATIAIIQGKITVSRRDLPVLLMRGEDGATTVTTTMIGAALAGIRVFATGGIGGVHRGAETTMDISADLEELAQTPVMVICAGAKSILDLGLTLEYLEHPGPGTDAGVPGNTRRTGDWLRHGRTAGFLYPVFRLQGGLPPGYSEGNCGRFPGEAGLRPAGRNAGDQSDSGGILHGSGLYQ